MTERPIELPASEVTAPVVGSVATMSAVGPCTVNDIVV